MSRIGQNLQRTNLFASEEPERRLPKAWSRRMILRRRRLISTTKPSNQLKQVKETRRSSNSKALSRSIRNLLPRSTASAFST